MQGVPVAAAVGKDVGGVVGGVATTGLLVGVSRVVVVSQAGGVWSDPALVVVARSNRHG